MIPPFGGEQLDLDLVDPQGIALVRLFRHPGGDWEEPAPEFRRHRVDPPPGRERDYAVLYTADSLVAAATECRILSADTAGRYTYNLQLTKEYAVVRYEMQMPAIFIPLDGENKRTLGLRGLDPRYERHRAVADQLFTRFGGIVHGLSWESYHRNQPGRIYALWHHHKVTVGLTVTSLARYSRLVEDREWIQLLATNGDFEPLTA